MGASLRFLRGRRGRRRRQAHEQGLAACGVLGDGGNGKMTAAPQKGILKGLGRLSSKCNSLEEDIERRAPVETLAGPVVDQIKDALKLRL